MGFVPGRLQYMYKHKCPEVLELYKIVEEKGEEAGAEYMKSLPEDKRVRVLEDSAAVSEETNLLREFVAIYIYAPELRQ